MLTAPHKSPNRTCFLRPFSTREHYIAQRAQHGFSWDRQVLDTDHKIHVQTANDEHRARHVCAVLQKTFLQGFDVRLANDLFAFDKRHHFLSHCSGITILTNDCRGALHGSNSGALQI